MGRVSPGQSLRRPASEYNRILDATDWYHLNKQLGEGGPPDPRLSRDPDVIKIKNSSGAARARFDVLALDVPQILPSADLTEFNRQPYFNGITPQAVTSGTTHVGRWAMLLEPAGTSVNVRAATGGIWPCLVNLTYEAHEWCDIAHNSHTLTSNWYGCGQILWHEYWGTASTGSGKAIVRIGNFTTKKIEGKVADSGGISAGGSGLVSIYRNGVVTSPLQQVTAYYRWITPESTLPQNTNLELEYDRDYHRWEVDDNECV